MYIIKAEAKQIEKITDMSVRAFETDVNVGGIKGEYLPVVSTPRASAMALYFSPVTSALNSMTMGSIIAQATPWGVS